MNEDIDLDPRRSPNPRPPVPVAGKASQSNTNQMEISKQLIAEINRLKIALLNQQIQNDALINSLGEGLIIVDPHGDIAKVNAYASAALGFTEEELIGKWFPKTIVAVDQHGNTIDPMARPITEALTEGKPISEYTSLLRKDGSSLPVLLTASPVIMDGKPAGAIEVFRDLTKERQLDLAKDDFVAIASHQLRTPATGIKAILSMLQGENFGPLNEKQQRYLGMATQSNDRQLRIIEDLLSVARADAGTMDLALDYVDLTELVNCIVREHAPDLKARRQQLQFQSPAQLHIVGDGQKLQMVIDNLISNASKYTPKGGRISVRLTRTDSESMVEVTDTGVGIAAEHLNDIFAKFGRINNELSVPGGSTGLGLYLAKKIMNLHNGDISVQSQTGQGSTFTITLPNAHERE
jgi:PAS domain S-box-containing protein